MHAISLFLRARKMSPFATATLLLSTLSLQACVTTNGDAAFQKLEQATQTPLAKRINWQRSEAEVELADGHTLRARMCSASIVLLQQNDVQ